MLRDPPSLGFLPKFMTSATSGAYWQEGTALQEHAALLEIDAEDKVNAVAFTADGAYLVSGGSLGVRVWRVKDGKRVATMPAVECSVRCVAVSKDGKWISAGSPYGEVFVWDAETYKAAFAHKTEDSDIMDVDFSPDSTQLVTASHGYSGTATIWQSVKAARYSPQGDRIATATSGSVQVWDSNEGHLLVEVTVNVIPRYHCLLWFNSHLFVTADDRKINQIDADTGSTISEWSVSRHEPNSLLVLPQHAKFLAYSSSGSVTFWGTSTHTQLCLVPQYPDIVSTALSLDDQLLAIATEEGKIIIRNLSLIIEPAIHIERVVLGMWKNDQLTEAEASLTAAIPKSQNTVHHVLACRALVRVRLRQLDTAVVDAEESIKIQASVIGYIAKCVVLVERGEICGGLQLCDLAFQHFHSNHVTLLLLIKAVVLFIAGEHDNAISRMDSLIATVYFNSVFYVVQAYMYFHIGKLCMESSDYERAIQSFEHARVKLGNRTGQPLLIVSLISGWKFDDLANIIQRRFCEALFVAGRTKEVTDCLLRMANQRIGMTRPNALWICDLMRRCLSASQVSSGTDQESVRQNELLPRQDTHCTTSSVSLLGEWTKLRLTTGSWKDALADATAFILPRFTAYQVLCEHLEMMDNVADAVACFRQIYSELEREMDGEQQSWIQNFQSRCRRKLEGLGDNAMNIGRYDEAIMRYTDAMALGPTSPQDLLVKRSKAHAGKGGWEDALRDANEVIKVDPSSPLGYERKHEALRGAGYYEDAISAFETMLSMISQHINPGISESHHHYVSPEQTREVIRATIKDIIHDSPLILIETTSGRVCTRSERSDAFTSTPAFIRLTSSMTTHIDHALIQKVVGDFYRYAMLSHTWEESEPLFSKVSKTPVYDLEESPAHKKLKMFCKIVCEAGFNWAWSDTCCIDQTDHVVLQEALISMFKWYEGSAMTIIFLRGVYRLALCGALKRSIWNTRGWTLQEYHASKVVQFYTEDWTPYLGLDIYNHKESPMIISEMQEATGISADDLMALCPGINNIREKLCLASTRRTTRIEDAAYSLLGIFSASLPIVYGEGDKALGRLLGHLLMSSGDTSILSWTGRSGSLNSCFPNSITVFQHPPTHIPQPISDDEMETTTARLRVSSLDFALATNLYDRLQDLPIPLVAGLRIKLPCLAFKLGRVALSSHNASERVFRAQTATLGVVEIKTEKDLERYSSLYLVHPWIDFLLDREPVGSVTGTLSTENILDERLSSSSSLTSELPWYPDRSLGTSPVPPTRAARLLARLGRPFGGRPASSLDVASLRPPSTVTQTERQTRVLQFIARLQQPFGALLLTLTAQVYRRIASESLIVVRMEEIKSVTLEKVMQSVRMLDVL